jgi:CheY-like chemotaxis protein
MDNIQQKGSALILVVDDYVVIQRMLSTLLRNGGYDVVTAGSGQEALTQLNQRRFDLAIIDVTMPDMDGITLLEKVRMEQGNTTLPVIMLTASALDEDRIRSQAAGANNFLTKPVSSREMLDVVHGQLAKTQATHHTNQSTEARLLDLGRRKWAGNGQL